ncbi:helix-turn-helix domain-containing protein, partial [Aeribacillus pallidus]
YEVSYQQVYQWVKKYENGGEEALKDKRGRKKDVAVKYGSSKKAYLSAI